MMYYFFLFIGLLVLSYADFVIADKKTKYLLLAFASSLLVFTAGLRYETGVDWVAYQEQMNNAVPLGKMLSSDISIFDSMNIGFDIFLALIKSLGGDLQLVFFIVSFATTFLIVKGLLRYTESPIIGLLLYYCLLFFMLDMSGIRQGLALAIFFYAIKYIQDRRIVKYFICIVSASLFHFSALLLILPYFFSHIRYSTKSIIIFFTATLAIFIFDVQWLSRLILFFFPYLEKGLILDKVLTYTTNPALANSRGFTFFTILNIFFLSMILCVNLIYRNRLEQQSKYFNVFLNIFLLHVFAFFCLSEFLDLGDRLRLYFLIADIVLLPWLIPIFNEKVKQVMVYVAILAFGLITGRAYLFEFDFTIAYHPYQNYFIYKAFGLKSTGEERMKKHVNINE